MADSVALDEILDLQDPGPELEEVNLKNDKSEEQLVREALADMGPALEVVQDQFIRSVEMLRTQNDTGLFWHAVENLQLFLQLLHHILVQLGEAPDSVGEFSDNIAEAIKLINQAFDQDVECTTLADIIENNVFAVFATWGNSEKDLWQLVNAAETWKK
jgi:hypothetical protein